MVVIRIKWVKALAAVMLVVATLTGPVHAAGQAQVDPAALAVAQRYFDALRAGDRQTLLTLLAGNERANNAAQLNDPAYSQFLIDRYKNARLEIVDGRASSGVAHIDIAIWLNAAEAVKERLILKASGDSPLSIVARKELD